MTSDESIQSEEEDSPVPMSVSLPESITNRNREPDEIDVSLLKMVFVVFNQHHLKVEDSFSRRCWRVQ